MGCYDPSVKLLAQLTDTTSLIQADAAGCCGQGKRDLRFLHTQGVKVECVEESNTLKVGCYFQRKVSLAV